jgi:hypothetical protein
VITAEVVEERLVPALVHDTRVQQQRFDPAVAARHEYIGGIYIPIVMSKTSALQESP